MLSDIYKNTFIPDGIAIRYKGKSITYEQLDTKVNQYASYFSQLGIKKGDKVVLSCLNSPEFIFSYLGIVKLGAVIVPINLLLTPDEISYIIKNSEAKIMIIHPIILSKLKHSNEFVKQAIGTLLKTYLAKTILKQLFKINVIMLDEDFIKNVDSIKEFDFEEATDENLISTFLYTSGTTGKPKAAMLSHKNLVANTDQSSKTIEFTPKDNFICVLPMFHSFAFTVCVLLPLYRGCTVTILDSFQPKEIIDTLINENVTVFSGVPSMYVVLINAVKENKSFPYLRLAVCGGSSLPEEIFKQARESLKFPIVEGYGLSEASPVVAFNPMDKPMPGSIGFPIHDVTCKIVDENDNEIPVGEVGELTVHGNNVMQGYYHQEEQSAETLKNGWLHTGDMAKKDKEGYLYIVDRKKDMVIVGGFNVYPREVEEVLYTYPKVKEAAVVGINDGLRGEYVKAFVVLKESEECTSKELTKYLREHLALYKLPREIEFIKQIPKKCSRKNFKKSIKKSKIRV
jgi:long-chain acyl-CoA synthetase